MACRARPVARATLGLGALLLALLVPARPAAAHDVPDEMVFYAHVAPEAGQLHVPLRVPLVWLVDYALPKRGPGYLDLADAEGLESALAMVTDALADDIVLFEGDERLEAGVAGWRLSLPSDRSFDNYDDAVESIAGPPLPRDTNLFWNQGYLDVHFVSPIADETSTFSLLVGGSPALAERLHVFTTFVAPNGASRSYDLLGTMGRVELNPGPGYLARLFARHGLINFLASWEHVLFVAALALALARRPAHAARPVVAFGVVASLIVLTTGAVAGLDGRFGELLVAVAAAATLVVIAIGNIVARDLRHRWLTAAVCAIPHGLLLAGGLDVLLQFRDAGDVLPLVAYAIGAQIGVAAVFGAGLGVGWLVTRHAGARRHGPVVAALLVGYVGWHYTLERGELLRAVPPPPFQPAMLAGFGRWAVAVVLILAALWLAFELFADRRGRDRAPVAEASAHMRESPGAASEPSRLEPVDASGDEYARIVAATSAGPGRHSARNGSPR